MKYILLLTLSWLTLLGAIGEVTALKGNADIHRDQNTLQAEKGSSVEVKDLIETYIGSRAQIILQDHTIITIGPESRYVFDLYKDGKDSEVEMHLERGFFRIITGEIGKLSPERFHIKTKAASIGIRGTQFMATIDGDDETIGCASGAITVTTKQGTFNLDKGMMILYRHGLWRLQTLEPKAFGQLYTNTTTNSALQKVRDEEITLPIEQLSREQMTDKPHVDQQSFLP